MGAHSRAAVGHRAHYEGAPLSMVGSTGMVRPKCPVSGRHTTWQIYNHNLSKCQEDTRQGAWELWASDTGSEACDVVVRTHGSWARDARAVPHVSREAWCAPRARARGPPAQCCLGGRRGDGYEEGPAGDGRLGWAVSVVREHAG